jgi:hypothetical protein
MTTKEVKEMQVKQAAHPGDFALFADGAEMTTQGFSDVEVGSLLTVAALAHVKGKFREIYCSEAEPALNEFPKNVAWNLQATRTVTVNLPGWGGYACVSIGPGWFSWAMGCSMASAISEIWADASVAVYKSEDYE